jgi:hypothetical protein
MLFKDAFFIKKIIYPVNIAGIPVKLIVGCFGFYPQNDEDEGYNSDCKSKKVYYEISLIRPEISDSLS